MGHPLAWMVFCAVFLAAYFISTTIPMPLLWHLPVERRWVFEVFPQQLGADYYGRLIFCLVAGAIGGLLARSVALTAARVKLLTAWTLGLLTLTAALYVYTLAARQPIPAPLPPGHVAR